MLLTESNFKEVGSLSFPSPGSTPYFFDLMSCICTMISFAFLFRVMQAIGALVIAPFSHKMQNDWKKVLHCTLKGHKDTTCVCPNEGAFCTPFRCPKRFWKYAYWHACMFIYVLVCGGSSQNYSSNSNKSRWTLATAIGFSYQRRQDLHSRVRLRF